MPAGDFASAQILARCCRSQHFGLSGVAHIVFSLMFSAALRRPVTPSKRKKETSTSEHDTKEYFARSGAKTHAATTPLWSATAPPHAAALSSANPRSSFVPSRTRGDFSRGFNARARWSMGTTSSAPARDSRGDLRQRAAQQARQPRYTVPPGYANAPQPFQGQQNYAAPRYYGQVRAQRDRGLAEDPPPSRSLPCHAKRAKGRPTLAFERSNARCSSVARKKNVKLLDARRDSQILGADLVAADPPSRSRTSLLPSPRQMRRSARRARRRSATTLI